MSALCLKQSLIRHGKPLYFFSALSVVIGVLFILLETAAGWSFLLATLGAWLVFSLLGARQCLAQEKKTYERDT